MNYSDLLTKMSSCEQTEGISTLDHGVMVANYYKDLLNLLKGKPYKYEWDLSKFNIDQLRELATMQVDPDTAWTYQVYHDCGKWKCLTIDEEGKRHFPNHAEISYEIFRETFPQDIDAQWLIRLDMLFHTGTCEDIKNCIDTDLLPTLALTAIAELHANASMFGGIDSTSFKIKAKKIGRNIKQLDQKITA